MLVCSWLVGKALDKFCPTGVPPVYHIKLTMSSFCSELLGCGKALYCSSYMEGNGESTGSLIKRCIVLDLPCWAMDGFVLVLEGNVRNCGKRQNIAKPLWDKDFLSIFLYCSKCSNVLIII